MGDQFDAASCTASNACATPASNNARSLLPIGPAPIVTTSINTSGQTDFTTTLGQLSLGTDDGIGGSPMTTGPFAPGNFNYDFTSLTVTGVSAVPVPAAVWLFGSGMLGLLCVSRRKKTAFR